MATHLLFLDREKETENKASLALTVTRKIRIKKKKGFDWRSHLHDEQMPSCQTYMVHLVM